MVVVFINYNEIIIHITLQKLERVLNKKDTPQIKYHIEYKREGYP